MDEFEAFFAQQKAPAAPATAATEPAGEFDDFFEFQRQQQEQVARDAVAGAYTAKPDEVGKAMTLGPKFDLPAQAVETDIPSFEAQLKMRNASTYVERNPVIQRWLAGDANRARVAIDDFENLDVISQSFRALSSGWGESFIANERARLQAEQSTIGTDNRRRMDALDKRLARNPKLAGVMGWLQFGASGVGGIFDSAIRAIDDMALGATTGAAVGAAATPEALGVGAVPGFFVGAAVGGAHGFMIDQSLIMAGQTYQALEGITDEAGRPVDPEAKHAAALGVFLAAYGLNYVGGSLLWGSAEKALQTVAVEAVKRPTMARALGQFGREMGKAGVEGAAIMGMMEASAVFAQDFAKTYSSDDFETIFNNPAARAEAAQRLTQAMTAGAVFMPFVKLPFEAKTFYTDMVRARQARADAALMQSLAGNVQKSKVRERNLDAFQALIRESIKDGSPIDEVGVPVAAVMELYQSLKIEPGADDGVLGAVAPDIAKQIEQASATGGDIRLNLEAYTAKMAGSDVWNHLSADLRLRPEGMTLREAEIYEKARGQILEDNAVDMAAARKAGEKADDGASKVFDDAFSKMRRAGLTIDAATQVATLWASRYRARSEARGFGEDAFDLYEGEDITIRRELPPTVRRVGVDRADILIEALRRGEPVPSDRKLYGPTVIEYIKKAGGVFEERGELKARDLHKMRGFVRSAKKGGDKETFGMDGMARALWEAGYFPELQDRPTINDLLEAIDEELNGNKRYQYGTDREAEALFKKAMLELDEFLGVNDIDVKKTSNAKIKKLLSERGDPRATSKEFEQLPPEVVKALDIPLKLPDTPEFAKAVEGTKGAEITPDGLLIDLERWQTFEQMGGESVRTGVFYLPAGSKNLRHYRRQNTGGHTNNYGGEHQAVGKTLIRAPIFVKGNTGGKAPEAAYEAIKGKGSFKKLKKAIHNATTGNHFLRESDPQLYYDELAKMMREFGAENIGSGEIRTILHFSRKGNQLRYAVQENIIAHVVRAAGYDSVVGYTARRGKNAGEYSISEVFDVREDAYPDDMGGYSVHPFFASGKNVEMYQSARRRSEVKTVLEPLADGETAEAGFERIKAKYPNAKLIKSEGVEPGGTQYARARVAISDLPASERPGAYREFYQSKTDARGLLPFKEMGQQRGAGDVRRGSIRLEDGRAVITLFKDADLSTLLHESGHQFLEEMRRDYLDVAERLAGDVDYQGGQQLAKDFETVLAWMGAKSPDAITVEMHEKFARGFELYLMEGKAPSSALARAFRAFRQWLVRIYREAVGLNVEISNDMRRVFDRLVATEDEIAAAVEAQSAAPAFASAKDAGMTDAEFAAYGRKIDAMQKDIDEAVLSKAMASIRAQRTKEWKAQYAEMRETVKGEVTSRQDLRAEHWLRTGKLIDGTKPEGVGHIRLDAGMIAAMYGHKGIIEMLPERMTTPKDGVHPDLVATMFGYKTGDDLITALIELEGMRKAEAALTGKPMGARYVDHIINRETHERMLDRHGDALNDGSIEQEAIDALRGTARLEVLGTELKAIARRAGKMPVSIDDIDTWVSEQITDMPVHRARSDIGFSRAEAAAGKEVQRALLKGDYRAAFVAKQRQIVNTVFAKKAREAAKDYEAAMKMFTRYAKKAVHKNLEAGFVDQMHAMLVRIGFKVARQDLELAAGLNGTTLREFVDGKRSDGFDLIAAEYLLDPLWEKPVADMTMGEVRDVADFFRSMIHAARFEKQIKIGEKVEAFEAIKEKALETLAKRDMRPDLAVKGGVAIRSPDVAAGGVKDSVRAGLFRYRTGLDRLDSNLRKIEELCDILDGDDSNGVFNTVVFRSIADAEHKEADMRRTITAKWIALRDGMSKEWKQSLDAARITVPELRKKTGEAWQLTKSELLMIALNLGSKSNKEKLLKGEFWDEAAVTAALDRLLTKEDWEFVQGTWDIVNSLWPEIDAMERRLSGVGPDKVEAIKVVTKHGTYAGGYFPIMYDATQSLDSRMKIASNDAHLYDGDYQRATTPKGHTKRRVEGYAREIDISGFARIANHLENVIHDLSFREVLMQTSRFIKDAEIREGIVGVIGKENYMQLFPWLKHIANETAIDQRGLGFFDKFVKRVRLNATMVGLGFRASTMIQQLAGFGDSAEFIGAKHVADGFRAAYGFGSPLEALSKGIRLVSQTKAGKVIGAKWLAEGFDAVTGSQRKFENARNFVIERSGEVRNRFETIDRDMRQGMKELLGKTGMMAEVRRFAYYGIAMMDQSVVVPTWIGAYRKAIAGGKVEADAIYYADKAVRLSQGSGAPKDLAAVARSHNKWFDLITMFYSYFSHFQNRLMRLGGKVKSGTKAIKAGDWKQGRKDYAEALARFWWLCVVPPIAANLLTGRGPEEGEDVAGWAMRKVTFNMFGGVPVARDFAAVAERQLGGQMAEYKFTPAERAGTTLTLAAKDAWNATFGDEPVSDKWLKHAIETAGYVGGLPGAGQLATSSQYLAELNAGERDPETAAQFMGELLLGPPPKEK